MPGSVLPPYPPPPPPPPPPVSVISSEPGRICLTGWLLHGPGVKYNWLKKKVARHVSCCIILRVYLFINYINLNDSTSQFLPDSVLHGCLIPRGKRQENQKSKKKRHYLLNYFHVNHAWESVNWTVEIIYVADSNPPYSTLIASPELPLSIKSSSREDFHHLHSFTF